MKSPFSGQENRITVHAQGEPSTVPISQSCSYSTLSDVPVGSDWQVRIHPSSTSSSVRALFTRILTEPSRRRAMQVAQLPASQENGTGRFARRAVSSTVSPAW